MTFKFIHLFHRKYQLDDWFYPNKYIPFAILWKTDVDQSRIYTSLFLYLQLEHVPIIRIIALPTSRMLQSQLDTFVPVGFFVVGRFATNTTRIIAYCIVETDNDGCLAIVDFQLKKLIAALQIIKYFCETRTAEINL